MRAAIAACQYGSLIRPGTTGSAHSTSSHHRGTARVCRPTSAVVAPSLEGAHQLRAGIALRACEMSSSSSSSTISSSSSSSRMGTCSALDETGRDHGISRVVDDNPVISQRAMASFAVAGALALPLLCPAGSLAAEASVIPIDVFVEFLDKVESMGTLGSALFTTTVMMAECIPLFPTQPLSIAAGLLYGTYKGAGLCLGAYVGASITAFLLARGVGRPLAEKVIQAEMSEEGEGGDNSILANVQDAIKNGTELQQFVSIVFLRLTPVVPFSASNYVLGLSPLNFLPYFGATVVGMTPWAILFASLGSAGRSLLDGGEDFQQVLGELGEKASVYTEEALAVAVSAAVIGGGIWALRRQQGDEEGADALPEGASPEGAKSQTGTKKPSKQKLRA